MSLINVTDVQVLDNPTKFTNQFQFEITFECLPPGVQEGTQHAAHSSSSSSAQHPREARATRSRGEARVSTVERGSSRVHLREAALDSNREALHVSRSCSCSFAGCLAHLGRCSPAVVCVCAELEWKLTYVGSATDEKYDQELDSVLVGPVVVGKNKFVFAAPAPDPTLIPKEDIMEVTVLLLTASYKDKEFIRIGYYVNTEINPAEVALCAERDAWLGRCTALQQQHQEVLQQIRAQQESLNVATEAALAAAAAAGQAPPERVVLPTPPEPAMPPSPAIDITKLQRNILADKPRVTRFTVPWDEPQAKEVRHSAKHRRRERPEGQLLGRLASCASRLVSFAHSALCSPCVALLPSLQYTMDAADEAKAASDAAADSAGAAGSSAADVEDDAAEDEEESEEDDEGEMDDVGDAEVADEEEEAAEDEGEEEEEDMANANANATPAGQQKMEA